MSTAFNTYTEPIGYKALEKARGRQPHLGTLVTVDNCYYYMSLLENFYNIEQSLGPELFKLYIVAAERRYLEFMRIVGKRDTLERWDSNKPLPLDIAYAWHAHLLAPNQYRDDTCPDSNFTLIWSHDFPLKAMHKQQIPSKSNYFENYRRTNYFFVYPFILSKEELQQTSLDNRPGRDKLIRLNDENDTLEGETHTRRALYIQCASCNTKIYFENWSDYAGFRTDPTVVLKCPAFNCKHPDNTVDSLSVANILSSLPFDVRGTKLDSRGEVKDSGTISEEKAAQTRIHTRIKESDDVFYGSKDMSAVLNCIANSKGSNDTDIIDALEDKSYCSEFSKVAESTYKNNPTGLSLDLIQAMFNQREFIRTMVTEIAPKWNNPMEHDFPKAIKNYHDFLLLLKVQKDSETQNAILPTWTTDLVWRTHMLHPSNYRYMMISQLGRVPNHNTSVLSSHLEESFTITKNAWKQLPSSFTRSIDITKLKDFAHRTVSKKAAIGSRNYYPLRERCVSSNMRNKMATALFEDISYHSTPAPTIPFICETQNGTTEESNDTEKQAHPFLPITADEESQSNLVISEAMASQVREEIFSNISHTGYGYIGTIFDGIVNRETAGITKRIDAKTYGPRCNQLTSRWYGRIPQKSTIVVYHKLNPEDFIGKYQDDYYNKRTDLKLIKPLQEKEKKYEWWVSKDSLYGMMRRKYSKKHKQWGWTTDGLDWYSERECQFKTLPSGKFNGARFFPQGSYYKRKAYSGYASLKHNTIITSNGEASTTVCALSNFGSADVGGSCYGGGGSSSGWGSGGGGDSGGGGGGDGGGGGGGGGGGCGGGGGD